MFKDEDIGQTVRLHIDPEGVPPDWIKPDGHYVPFDAITEYSFTPKVRVITRAPRIIDTSLKEPRIDPASLGRGIGAEYITLEGVIEDIQDDYVRIKKSL